MAKQTKIGDSIYLFEGDKTVTKCLITAHGADVGTWLHMPPKTTLHYFTPHGYTLRDPGVDFIAKAGNPTVVEVIKHGDKPSADYMLYKYQGYHGNEKETYEKILKLAGKHMHVATIRNRQGVFKPSYSLGSQSISGGMPLSLLLRDIKKERPHITDFYCSFCRSSGIQGVDNIPVY